MSPDNTAPDADETMMVDDGEGTPKKKGGFPSMIIYLGIAVVMIVAGVFVGTHFMKSADGEAVAEEKQEEPAHEQEPAALYMINDIIVNPAGTAGTRFLSASIGFESFSPETAKRLEEREPLVRDALISILGAKTIEQLSDPKQKEIIRYQIKKRTEQLLRVDDLAAVYFTEFILQ
ncbi:MAG: flagellar basal body-associated FliL family protein [candidate division Zixibacteria bacterium]|nr:flagellar basal body-associated FliL family protein [candidate division Zixibacteria bacterium]